MKKHRTPIRRTQNACRTRACCLGPPVTAGQRHLLGHRPACTPRADPGQWGKRACAGTGEMRSMRSPRVPLQLGVSSGVSRGGALGPWPPFLPHRQSAAPVGAQEVLTKYHTYEYDANLYTLKRLAADMRRSLDDRCRPPADRRRPPARRYHPNLRYTALK